MNIIPPLDSGNQQPENPETPECYEHFFYADQLEICEEDNKPIEFGKYTFEDIKRLAEQQEK